jgi:hypothetical protein
MDKEATDMEKQVKEKAVDVVLCDTCANKDDGCKLAATFCWKYKPIRK